jgi:hypothetical protein
LSGHLDAVLAQQLVDAPGWVSVGCLRHAGHPITNSGVSQVLDSSRTVVAAMRLENYTSDSAEFRRRTGHEGTTSCVSTVGR